MYAEKFVKIFIEDILDDLHYKMYSVSGRVFPEAVTVEEWEKVEDETYEILTDFLDSF